RVLIMRSGADSEMTSGVSGVDVEVIKQAPGILRDGNRPIASAELFVIVDLNKRSTGTPANVPLRGIEPVAMQLRDEVKVVDGRMFRFGTNEAIVGRAANRQFSGVDLGSELKSGQLTLTVVGTFAAQGSVAETEIWCDSHLLQAAYRRGNSYQSVLAYLAFNGYQTSTMNFQTFSQVAFAFAVTPPLLIQGLSYALVMGLIGGLWPAIRAARLPIPSALREL